MDALQNRLCELSDETYKAFNSKLIPNVDPQTMMGIRVPALRSFAKRLQKEEAASFMAALPHDYFDENMLHSLLLSDVKDMKECLSSLEAFLPYVDNWAVCDILSPKCFKKKENQRALLKEIRHWIQSKHVYTCRFGIETLMRHFLDENFNPDYLGWVANIRSEEYYLNMMIAWYFATAMAKQWDAAVGYIEEGKLAPWTQNKAIQKAIESYRITDEQKAYLKKLKVKK